MLLLLLAIVLYCHSFIRLPSLVWHFNAMFMRIFVRCKGLIPYNSASPLPMDVSLVRSFEL